MTKTTVITATVPLFVSKEKEQDLFDICNSFTTIQNAYSKRLFETFGKDVPEVKALRYHPKELKSGKISPGYKKLTTKLAYEIQALPIIQDYNMRTFALENVSARYQSARSNNHTIKKPIEFKKIESKFSWRTSLKATNHKLNDWAGKAHEKYQEEAYNHFDLSYPGVHGKWITVKADIRPWQHDLLNSAVKFGESTLYYRPFNKQWYLAISVELPISEQQDVHTVVGMNLGINHVATLQDTNNRTQFVRGHEIKEKKRKFILKATELQKAGTKASRRRIRKIGSREQRWQKDINHGVSRELITKYGAGALFIMEDLSGRNLQQTLQNVPKQNRRLQKSWAYYQFREMMTYKSIIAGSSVLLVNPRNISITCSKCGYCNKKNRSYKPDQFKCIECQYTINQDLNAARNVLVRGLDLAVKKKLIKKDQFSPALTRNGQVLDGILHEWSDKDKTDKAG